MAIRICSRRVRVGLLAGIVLLMQSVFIVHLEFSTRSLDIAKKLAEDDSAVHIHVFIQDTRRNISHESGTTRKPRFMQNSRDEHTGEERLKESQRDVEDTKQDVLKRRVALDSNAPIENVESANTVVMRKKFMTSSPPVAKIFLERSSNDTLTMKTFPARSSKDIVATRSIPDNSPNDSLDTRDFPANSSKTLVFRNIPDSSSRLSHPQVLSDSRLTQARNVCHSHDSQIAGSVDRVYIYEAEKVAYCSTHKIGSTFWTRIYRWLYNDTLQGHVASPLLISKFETHLVPMTKLKVRNIIQSESDRELAKASYRFLFTRDPYARLWSVYIDKFVLPDNFFWGHYAPRIKASVYGKALKTSDTKSAPTAMMQNLFVKGRLRDSQNIQQVNQLNFAQLPKSNSWYRNDLKNKTVEAGTKEKVNEAPYIRRPTVKCLNVTFQEFLQYIVNVVKSATLKALDDHFRPVHFGCNPCKFQPNFIGHMETMTNDSAHVLRQMKLEDVLHELNSVNHVEQEIDMLIAFNFRLVVKMNLQRACVTNKDLERRLLKTFIYNGYIPAESESLLEKVLPLGQANFQKAILNIYRNSRMTSDDIRKQRESYKIEAYRKIPRDLLVSIQKVFHWDFELFGYEPFPPELFDQ